MNLFQAERYIVNGCHDQRKLQDMLDGFIKKFVLCEKCENPETVIKVKKNLVGASCRACGHAYVMDMRHKLTTFIVKVIIYLQISSNLPLYIFFSESPREGD